MKYVPTDSREFKPMEIKLNEVGSLVLKYKDDVTKLRLAIMYE